MTNLQYLLALHGFLSAFVDHLVFRLFVSLITGLWHYSLRIDLFTPVSAQFITL